MFEAADYRLDPSDLLERNRYLARVREQLDPEIFAAAWAAGHAMTLDQAITYALEAV